MRTFFVVALLALSAVASADIPEENDVLVLSKDNFAQALKDNEHILVEFYAPWCGHCKALAPEYDKAAGDLKSSGSAIRLAKVDATIEKELAEEHGVRGFPTLKFFKGGEARDYNGPREAKGIVSWLNKKTGPPAQTLSSVDEAEKLEDANEVAVVGFFKDDEEAKAFTKVADEIDDIPFAVSSEKAVLDHFKIKKTPAIILLKKFDEKRNDYEGEQKAEDIKTFVTSNSIRLVSEFTQETAPKLFSTPVKNHFLLLADKTKEKDFDLWVEDALQPVAKKFKGKIIFVTLDVGVEAHKQILEFFGVKETDLPKYIIYQMEKSAKYLSDASISKENVEKFVTDFFDDKLVKSLKSEAVPEDWDKEPVKVLVGENFQKVALDKSKDVFVEFYAPWCGHCKALTPKWDKLGEHFKDSKDVIIAKLDATANEVEEVQVTGFPTLKFFKKDTNEIVDYNGPRETEDMIKFVEAGGVEAKESDTDAEKEDKGKPEKEEL